MTSIYGTFEKNHGQILKELDQLYESLRRFHYEGKPHRGKNCKEIAVMLSRFEREIAEHLRQEEKVLFPFLEKHVPKLQSLIYLLLSEHEDFRNSLGEMRQSLKSLKHGVDVSIATHRIYQRGVYFICLLRSHMWVESQNLYKTVDKELQPQEKRRLIQMIREES